MTVRLRNLRVSLAALYLIAFSPLAEAHLMVAQHGTLNVVGSNVYMVLSLPASAFPRSDADGDGTLSMIELNKSRSEIVAAIRAQIELRDAAGPAELHGVTLSPVMPHKANADSVSQLIVMGRFALRDAGGSLNLHIGLYGKERDEQTLEITATRQADQSREVQDFSPAVSSGNFF